jgi:hypothetical protein
MKVIEILCFCHVLNNIVFLMKGKLVRSNAVFGVYAFQIHRYVAAPMFLLVVIHSHSPTPTFPHYLPFLTHPQNHILIKLGVFLGLLDLAFFSNYIGFSLTEKYRFKPTSLLQSTDSNRQA